jgi:hypothetical protein
MRNLHMREKSRFLDCEEFADRNNFPDNLRDWLADPAFAAVVSGVVERSGECPAFQPLLGVLVYSYAAGIYLSAEIARLLSKTTGFFEDEAALRRYRRHHLTKVKDCLAEVLATASEGYVVAHDCAREAEDRVLRALREDSWTLDF